MAVSDCARSTYYRVTGGSNRGMRTLVFPTPEAGEIHVLFIVGVGRPAVRNPGIANALSFLATIFVGSPTWIRTTNTAVNSRVLYR